MVCGVPPASPAPPHPPFHSSLSPLSRAGLTSRILSGRSMGSWGRHVLHWWRLDRPPGQQLESWLLE